MDNRFSPLSFDADLTDEALSCAEIARVNVPVSPLHKESGPLSMRVSEYLFGEDVKILKKNIAHHQENFCLVAGMRDQYVGYMLAADLKTIPNVTAKNYCTPALNTQNFVSIPLTPLYHEANIKSPIALKLPMGAIIDKKIQFSTDNSDFIGINWQANDRVQKIYIFRQHLAEFGQIPLMEMAKKYLSMPYIWGGRSPLGIDCSGFIQQILFLSMGILSPRDSDCQEGRVAEFDGIGDNVTTDDIRHGDFLFWPGHVGIVYDDCLIHAYGGAMQVVQQKLIDILPILQKASGQDIRTIRRLSL
jgi:cell wall-associated NlpC family hydrolase